MSLFFAGYNADHNNSVKDAINNDLFFTNGRNIEPLLTSLQNVEQLLDIVITTLIMASDDKFTTGVFNSATKKFVTFDMIFNEFDKTNNESSIVDVCLALTEKRKSKKN